jgi:hypothetical protein
MEGDVAAADVIKSICSPEPSLARVARSAAITWQAHCLTKEIMEIKSTNQGN